MSDEVDFVDYGVIKVGSQRGESEKGYVFRTINFPAELARVWPERVTYLRIVADKHGLHLYPSPKPSGARPNDRPVPFGGSK